MRGIDLNIFIYFSCCPLYENLMLKQFIYTIVSLTYSNTIIDAVQIYKMILHMAFLTCACLPTDTCHTPANNFVYIILIIV